MKVWIVMKSYPYEGDEVVAVHSRAVLAQEHRDALQQADEGYADFEVFDYEVLESVPGA